MSEKRSFASDRVINPLGEASPDRYQQGAWPTALLERMKDWVNRIHPVGEQFLDIGCGEGALLHSLGFFGTGIDLNRSRLGLAKERGLSVMLGDGTQLPFEDSRFSTVVSMEVLEHVPEMDGMIKEVCRVLDSGGSWVVSVPSVTLRSRYEMWREKRPYYCDENEHYREFSAVPIHGFENRFMLTSDFISLFEDNGFELLRKDGVRYLFPQWLARFPALQRIVESSSTDRLWSALPWVRNFPYWTILVLKKS